MQMWRRMRMAATALVACMAVTAGVLSLDSQPATAAAPVSDRWQQWLDNLFRLLAHVQDDPILEGPLESWYHQDAAGSAAYGGDHTTTYGVGNDKYSTNRAVWLLGHRNGRQGVWGARSIPAGGCTGGHEIQDLQERRALGDRAPATG